MGRRGYHIGSKALNIFPFTVPPRTRHGPRPAVPVALQQQLESFRSTFFKCLGNAEPQNCMYKYLVCNSFSCSGCRNPPLKGTFSRFLKHPHPEYQRASLSTNLSNPKPPKSRFSEQKWSETSLMPISHSFCVFTSSFFFNLIFF